MIVRDEHPGDCADIHRVVTAAFGRDDEARLVDRLRDGGGGVISLVACEGPRIVGHAMLSRMAAPFPALGLAPVSVAPARQRRGIGSALVRRALGQAAEAGWRGVFVLGDPAWYRRFGFDPALAGGFSCPYAGPHLMALALAGRLPVRHGAVDYAPAFHTAG